MTPQTEETPELYYARLKPYNPRLGHRIRGMFVRELERVVQGGDGISEIPVWLRVTKEQALKIKVYKQDDQDPRSHDAFDIVTEQQRMQIDAAEELARRAAKGFIQAPLSIPDSHIKARILDAVPASALPPPPPAALKPEGPVTSEEPSLAVGAENFVGRSTSAPEPPGPPRTLGERWRAAEAETPVARVEASMPPPPPAPPVESPIMTSAQEPPPVEPAGDPPGGADPFVRRGRRRANPIV